MIDKDDYCRIAFNAYVDRLTRINLMEPIADIMMGCKAEWFRMTGKKLTPSIQPEHMTLWINLDDKMDNGEYPSKEIHVGRLLAHVRDNIGKYLAKETRTTDQYSDDFRFNTIGMFPNLHIYVVHGGNCKMVQVGTETIEKPIYEMECG